MLHFFKSSVLEAQEVSPGNMWQNNVFISFLRVTVLGLRKKKEKTPITTNNPL